MKQHTIRRIPEALDRAARERARRSGKSLNSVLIEAIATGLDPDGEGQEFHDMDDLIGTWITDLQCEEALAIFAQVDPDLWR